MISIIKKIEDNTNQIINLVNSNQSISFLKPSIDEWSINECLDHIIRVEEDVYSNILCNMTTAQKHTNLEKFGFDKMYHVLVGKRNIKVKSPDLFIPDINSFDSEILIARFQNTRNTIVNLLKTSVDNIDCSLYDHPNLGLLTKTDWLYFMICHAERHCFQMNSVVDVIQKHQS